MRHLCRAHRALNAELVLLFLELVYNLKGLSFGPSLMALLNIV